jgi:hypothetical protein
LNLSSLERGLSPDRLKVLIEVRNAGSIAQAAPGDPVRQSQYAGAVAGGFER